MVINYTHAVVEFSCGCTFNLPFKLYGIDVTLLIDKARCLHGMYPVSEQCKQTTCSLSLHERKEETDKEKIARLETRVDELINVLSSFSLESGPSGKGGNLVSSAYWELQHIGWPGVHQFGMLLDLAMKVCHVNKT
jgi:hypothetical protein